MPRRRASSALLGAALLLLTACQTIAPPAQVPQLGGAFDLLVIADEAFLTALQPFAVHKAYTGIATTPNAPTRTERSELERQAEALIAKNPAKRG